jgi:hypothetical protein
MKQISVLCVALVVLGGCGGGNGKIGSSGNSVVQQPTPANTETVPGGTQAACPEPCEGPALMMKKINGTDWTNLNLTPKESGGLDQALKATRVAGPTDVAHIHADVKDGQLVFSSESVQNPAHLTGNEPEITVGTPNQPHSSIPVKLVATPAAARLLDEKAASSTH